MPEPIALPEDAARQIDALGPTDFVVGVASYHNAGTIGGVARAAWSGLTRAFPDARVAVVHADAGSPDGTLECAREAVPEARLVQAAVPVDRVSRLAPALVARADALRIVFAIAARLEAKGCAVFEADGTSASPDWAGRLLRPIADAAADYVAPYYDRHRFAGAFTTGVVAPFMRAVWGKRLRYPLGGDFACSARLFQRCLTVDLWRTDAARLGVDVGLAVQALAGGFRVAQAALGAKTLAASDGLDLSATIARVLGALFQEVERTVSHWQKVRASEPVPMAEPDTPPGIEPVPIDQARALDAFRLGARHFQEIWSPVLPPLALLDLQKLVRLPDAAFRVPDTLWARIVYDFALAWHLRVMNRDHLLSAFTPLYSGWLGGWVGEVQTATDAEVDARVEQLCVRYEAEKPYFISRWRSPDRFNP